MACIPADADRDYQEIIESVDPKDAYLAAAAQAGIRHTHPQTRIPWEMIITFLISQQKTIPAIQSLVEALCRTYGHSISPSEISCPISVSEKLYSFPAPEELARASLEELQAMKLGYRAKYIHRICRDACSGSLDLASLTQMDYDEAMAYLTGFYGIGKKVQTASASLASITSARFP